MQITAPDMSYFSMTQHSKVGLSSCFFSCMFDSHFVKWSQYKCLNKCLERIIKHPWLNRQQFKFAKKTSSVIIYSEFNTQLVCSLGRCGCCLISFHWSCLATFANKSHDSVTRFWFVWLLHGNTVCDITFFQLENLPKQKE